MAEYKAKLGLKESSRPKDSNYPGTKSGTRESHFQTTWEGTTKGKTKHIKQDND